MNDTIYALASGAGRAGIAVVRISGPGADEALRVLSACELPPPRMATRMRISDPSSGALLDDCLALRFPAPTSYTGESVVELQLHGGSAVIDGVVRALGGMKNFRLAEPGEFTRRAFHNDKIDLTEAEGLIDLIDAETEAQRLQALRQMQGALGAKYDAWREELVESLAHFEAAIDFPEEDLPESLITELNASILKLKNKLIQHLDDNHCGERLREGLHLAIVGPTNAGKSSLLNLLAKREAAIVSETAGTTRDVIEVRMDLSGYPVLMADTAGIRETVGDIEAEGVRRARERAADADLRIVVIDGHSAEGADIAADLIDETTIVAVNKIDLGKPRGEWGKEALASFPISVLTGEGIKELLLGLESAVKERIGVTESPVITRARHRDAVQDCLSALDRFRTAQLPELAAEDLRMAVRALGRITGRVDVEDLLDVIFRDFCIGK